MEECLENLGVASYFTILESNSGYGQVSLAKGDRQMTAFTSHAWNFQFKIMLFGLCNAPANFQRAIEILLAAFRCRSFLVYMDDFMIISDTFEDHLKLVAKVLSVLQSAGLSLKLPKCTLFSDAMDNLIHVIHPKKLAVVTRNTEAVKCFSFQKTPT